MSPFKAFGVWNIFGILSRVDKSLPCKLPYKAGILPCKFDKIEIFRFFPCKLPCKAGILLVNLTKI
jgi:hypothetical protein